MELETVRMSFLEELKKVVLKWITDDADWKPRGGSFRLGDQSRGVEIRFSQKGWNHTLVVTLDGLEYHLGQPWELVSNIARELTAGGTIQVRPQQEKAGRLVRSTGGAGPSSKLDRDLCRIAAEKFIALR